MKQEKASTIASLNTKLNDLLSKHQQKSTELNNKIVQIQTEIKEKSSALLTSLTNQQVDLVYHIYQTELDLVTKLNDINELTSNEGEAHKRINLSKQIAEFKGTNFKTEFIASANGNNLKIGEIIRTTEQVTNFSNNLINQNETIRVAGNQIMKTNEKNSLKKKFKLGIPLNKQIWTSIASNRSDCLAKSEMNKQQSEEYKRLQTYFRDLIYNKYKLETASEYMTKTVDGIRLRRVCNQRDPKCFANWYLIVNIKSEECILTCNNKCSHYHEEQTDETESEIKSTKSAKKNKGGTIFKKALKIDIPLNFETWKSFKNCKRNYLIKSNMNREQIEECKRLQEFFRDYILKHYETQTVTHLISKNSKGYRLERMHRQRIRNEFKIFSRYYLAVNVSNAECVFSCYRSPAYYRFKNRMTERNKSIKSWSVIN